MRTPLFVWMREAKLSPFVPNELRHSGILSLQWLSKNKMPTRVYRWEAPKGTVFIEEIADRIHRAHAVKESTYTKTLERIARTVYTGAPLTNYINRLGWVQCGAESASGLRCSGEWSNWTNRHSRMTERIEIRPIPMRPCKWCSKRVEFKPEWVDRHGQIRCNAPDCRRMSYLEHTPQSRGGIDLTPAQRKELDREAWGTQRAINYLNLRAKEIKHGRRTNHDLR